MPPLQGAVSVAILLLLLQAAPVQADDTYTETGTESSCNVVPDVALAYCVYLYVESTATCIHASATVLQCGGSVHVETRSHGIFAAGDRPPAFALPGDLVLEGQVWYEGCAYDYDPAGSTCHAYGEDPYDIVVDQVSWNPVLGSPGGQLVVDRTLPWQTFDCAALPCDWANINVHAAFTASAGVGIFRATESTSVTALALDYL